MRVVLTGATGNVGTGVLRRLAADDTVTEVVGVARRTPTWRPDKVRWVAADLGRDDLGPIMAGADAVIHLAWSFHPTHQPVKTWRNNVLGALRTFDAVAAAEVPVLVHASSVAAYSAGPADGSPVDESWPTHSMPTAAYGREKAYLERSLDAFEARHPGVRVVRLRPGFIFQETSAAAQRRIFIGPFLPGPLLRPGLVPVVPDVAGLRFQVLHTDDAAEAFRLALRRDVRGAFNLASGPVVDPALLAQLLGARTVAFPAGLARRIVSAGFHLHLMPASPELFELFLGVPVMDTARARRELGWEPTVDAVDTLQEFGTALRQGRGGPTPTLAARAGGRWRRRELATGVGQVGGVTPDGR